MELNRLINKSRNGFIVPILWVLFFVLSFRVMARFPSGIFEVLFVLVVIITFSISVRHIVLGWIHERSNVYQLVLIPLFILPFIVAGQAHQEFGQPYMMGLLAQRQHFIIFAGYFLLIMLQRKKISLEKLERYLIISLIIIMMIMSFFSIFVNPAIFSNTEFVEYNINKGWKYGFPSDVIATIILISCLKILRANKLKYLLVLLFGIMYFLVYIQDRSQIMMITMTIGLYFLRNVTLNKKIIYIAYGSIAIILTFIFLKVFQPDLIDHYVTLFSNASTILTGEQTSEYSTSVRLKESAIALQGITEHPWFGNGFVSFQYKGGFSGILGYFYAADVGILGNLFVYGFIGTFIFYIPFILVISWTKKLRHHHDILLTTCQYGLFFIFLDMITAASNIKYLGLPSIFFAIIYYYRYYVIPKKNSTQ